MQLHPKKRSHSSFEGCVKHERCWSNEKIQYLDERIKKTEMKDKGFVSLDITTTLFESPISMEI